MSGFGFIVLGQPIPQKRHRHDGRRKGGAYRDPATQAYEHAVGLSAIAAGMRGETGPFNLRVSAWRKSAHRYDVDNLLKSVLDGMTRAGALEDDNFTIVPIMWIEHMGTDKEHPRCVVVLEPIE